MLIDRSDIIRIASLKSIVRRGTLIFAIQGRQLLQREPAVFCLIGEKLKIPNC